MSFVIYRKYIPLAISSAAMTFMLLEYYSGLPFKPYADSVRLMSLIGTDVAMYVATVALFNWNYAKFKTAKNSLEKSYPLVVIASVLVLAVGGFAYGITSNQYAILSQLMISAAAIGQSVSQSVWTWYAAVRGLRFTTWQSTILTVVALMAIGGLASWFYIPVPFMKDVQSWLINIPDKAVIRGMLVGIAIGGVSASVRTLIGRETGFIAASEGG